MSNNYILFNFFRKSEFCTPISQICFIHCPLTNMLDIITFVWFLSSHRLTPMFFLKNSPEENLYSATSKCKMMRFEACWSSICVAFRQLKKFSVISSHCLRCVPRGFFLLFFRCCKLFYFLVLMKNTSVSLGWEETDEIRVSV